MYKRQLLYISIFSFISDNSFFALFISSSVIFFIELTNSSQRTGKSSLISSVGRVIVGPVIGFSIIKIFNLSGFAAGVLLIQSSMPSAILTYLIASMYSPKKIVDIFLYFNMLDHFSKEVLIAFMVFGIWDSACW